MLILSIILVFCSPLGATYEELLLGYVQQDDPEMVWKLLEHGANPKTIDKDGIPVIHYAKNFSLLALWGRGADVNALDQDGSTALHKACKAGQHHTIKALLAIGADPSIPNSVGRLAYDYAPLDLDNNYLEYLRQDLIFIKDKNYLAINSHNLLTFYVGRGDIHMVTWLIEHQADIHQVDPDERGLPLIHYAKTPDMLSFLRKQGLDINARDKLANTTLHNFCRWFWVEMAEELIGNGADIFALNQYGQTAYEQLVLSTWPSRIVKKLALALSYFKKDYVLAKGREQYDLMRSWLERDDILVISQLLSLGASANGEFSPPLLVHARSPQMLDLLISYNASPNWPDKYGHTPLQYYYFYDEPDMIKALLRKGAKNWDNFRHYSSPDSRTFAGGIKMLEKSDFGQEALGFNNKKQINNNKK